MKILSIGNFGHGWDGSICDEEHIVQALEKLGHEVVRWQREDVLEQTDKFLHLGDVQSNLDFVLISQWDKYPDLSWIKTPKVYWAFDYQADGQEWHERLIKESDLYLSKRIADSKHANWRWLSQDFAPSFLDRHPRIDEVEKDIDVLFTGSYLDWATERNETLKAVDEKFNLTIHSVNEWPGFKNQLGPIMDDKLPELYARARVVLSIDHTLEAGYWSDRNAQIMACGGFVLARWVPLAEARFSRGLIWYYNVEDCLEKIEHYLQDGVMRSLVAEGGYLYSKDNLMVEDRVKDLLVIVESIL